ncbi:hypothetical protein [Amycolatopsis minnesotensis]|uniref:Uncharacterized protein n=1 Tax=Amycolatopsis minnesotensis TaxID=337894 RepID=A0ABP5DL65_9PSEU
MELERLAENLHVLVDELAAHFGTGGGVQVTVDGDLDCDPTAPGRLRCWQYGVRLERPSGPRQCLSGVILPKLARAGWQPTDRSGGRRLVVQFSKDGANLNVHVAAEDDGVAILGSTRCVAA